MTQAALPDRPWTPPADTAVTSEKPLQRFDDKTWVRRPESQADTPATRAYSMTLSEAATVEIKHMGASITLDVIVEHEELVDVWKRDDVTEALRQRLCELLDLGFDKVAASHAYEYSDAVIAIYEQVTEERKKKVALMLCSPPSTPESPATTPDGPSG